MSLKYILAGVVLVVLSLTLTTTGQNWLRNKGNSSTEPKSKNALPIQPSELADVNVPGHLHGFEGLSGDVTRGRALFVDRLDCASCHAIEGGDDLGAPNLAAVARRRTAKQIVTSIIEPSREFAEGYRIITVIDVDGCTHSGVEIIDKSNEQNLVLAIGEETVVIPRTDIEEIVDDMSAMPEGQANELTPQEFSDLVAFLLTLR